MNLPKVLVVIVNFNGVQLLEKHLPSVVNTNYPNFKVVILDNASSDTSIAYVRKKYPEIEIIESDKNLGFGNANNLVFNIYPEYEYYALVNNDIDVKEDWLYRLVKTAEDDKSVGAVGPKILYAQKQGAFYIINSAGLKITKHDYGFDRYDGVVNDNDYSKLESVDGLCGATMLLRSDAVKQVEGFNPKMFFYYEDVDLSLRLKEAGWKVMYNGLAEVYHDHMATSGNWSSFKRNYLMNKNRIMSIASRKGLWASVGSAMVSFANWLAWKLWFARSGLNFRQFILNREEKK